MKKQTICLALSPCVIAGYLLANNMFSHKQQLMQNENIVSYSKIMIENEISLSANVVEVEPTQGVSGIDTYDFSDLPDTEVKDKVEIKVVKKAKIENRWNITLTNDEIDLLAKIVWIEARGESDKGQRAVIEVIFNRMIHKAFKGTLEEVVSARNQFCSWRLRGTANPTDKEYDNIKKVLNGDTDILTFDHVYFSTSPRNNLGVIPIGGHYFCKYEK